MAHEILEGKKNSIVLFISNDNDNLFPLKVGRPPILFQVAGKTILEWIISIGKKYNFEKYAFLGSSEEIEMIKSILENKFPNTDNSLDLHFFEFNPQKGISRDLSVKLIQSYLPDNSICMDGNIIFSETFFSNFLRNIQGHDKYALVKNEEQPKIFLGIGYFSKKHLENNLIGVKNAEDIYLRVSTKTASYFPTMVHNDKENNFWKIDYLWNLLDANQKMIEYIEEKNEGEVEQGVTITGKVSIEKGAKIRSGSYLEGPLIIGENCDVGPNCYLRNGVSLGEKVRIGNACELKNTIVYSGTHIAHLSYVGDSIIGSDCNFGAGTITGNLRLDDKTIKAQVNEIISTNRRKLGVIMGDNVKTAINVYFMPGIIVGNNSAIGTGVILNRNLPDNTFIWVEQTTNTKEWRVEPKKKKEG
ncbi:MAG: DapH/DapD/GlmU-related protein [Candidatus Thorarchaeota archaeon]